MLGTKPAMRCFPTDCVLIGSTRPSLADITTLWSQRGLDARSLLCDPNPNSPANSEAARMFSENKREYNRRVREIVEQSWTAD
ncbi:hypothetical protein TSUD_193180 [Trifolium subterraneum]|uniref:UBC core domain-containing protein n=1 Tax=Trifolium subterraneum TaxID=3900 RepID=A0A2Z6NUB2_TRISU|nr:hypothetical protein TSUD_193180 [Trifolium subterraneum]